MMVDGGGTSGVMRVMVTHGYVLMAPTPMSAGTVSHGCGCGWTQIYPWAVRGLSVPFYGPNLWLVASALSCASVGLPVDFRRLRLSVKSSALVHHFRGLDVASARLPHFRYFRQPLLFAIPSVIGPGNYSFSYYYIFCIPLVLLITCFPYPCILEVDTCL